MKHFDFLLSHWKLFIIVFFASLIASLLEGLGIAFIFPILEEVQDTQAFSIPFPFNKISGAFEGISLSDRIRIIALLLIVITAVKGGLQYVNALASCRLRAITFKHFRMLCFTQLMRVGMGYFNSQKSANFHTICYSYTGTLATLVDYISSAVPKIVNILILLTMLLILSWEMTLLSLIFVGIASFSSKILAQKAKDAGQDYNEANKAINSSLLDIITGMKIIRLFSREMYMASLWDRRNDQYSSGLMKRVKIRGKVAPAFEFLATTGLALMMIAGSYLFFQSDGGGLQTIFVFIIVFRRIAGPVSGFNQYRVDISGDIPFYREVFRFLEPHDKQYLKNGRKIFGGFQQRIEFHDVTFGYHSRESVALDKISFSIAKGSKVGIVGASGAGKSTLIELFLRFYDPQEGSILIDCTDLREFDIESWRKKISVVSQDIFLWNDTIRANITFAKPDATPEEIQSAARKAHSHEFIEPLPQGYDTLIGDRGVLLSGGQKQRIAIARAIIADPEILILDEATSALDSESEKIVQQALDEVGRERTVITIAHRLSTVYDADKILVMDNGRIVEQGTHEELVKAEKIYRQLVQMQDLAVGHSSEIL